MSIRNVADADWEVIAMHIDTAFGKPASTTVCLTDEARLVSRLRKDGDAVISLMAEDDGEIIGHVMLSKMSAPFAALGLAPLSVHPSYRDQGIGSALVVEAIKRARAENWAAIFVLGDEDFYTRFGFSARLAAGFACPFSGPHFMVLPLQDALPVMTGAVDYAQAFRDLVSQ